MLWDDIRVTRLIRWEWLPSTSVLGLQGMRQCSGTSADSPGVPSLDVCIAFYIVCENSNVCIVFHMPCEDIRATTLIPWDSRCVLCFAHDLRRYQSNTVNSLWVPTINVCLVFGLPRDDIRVTKLIPWECPHSTFVLCDILSMVMMLLTVTLPKLLSAQMMGVQTR